MNKHQEQKLNTAIAEMLQAVRIGIIINVDYDVIQNNSNFKACFS